MASAYELERRLRNLEVKLGIKERRLVERRDENDVLRESIKGLQKRIDHLSAELTRERSFRKIRITERGKRILLPMEAQS